MNHHYDWLTIEQDFGFEIPEKVLSGLFDFGMVRIHLDTGELQQGIRTGKYRHKGSYCDEVSIKITGSVIRMEGNPSRWGKTENLLGFKDIDSCVFCFNNILSSLNLPTFTRCTDIFYLQGKEQDKARKFSNGAIIKRLDITTNKSVGRGNEKTFIKALSQMRYRNSIGRLHTNCCTADWLSEKGNANLIYPSCYIKHEEMKVHSYDKIKNKFGEHSSEFQYYKKVYDYCKEHGVVRFEQKLKSRYLQREGLCYWGLSDFTKLEQLQEEFINMHKKLDTKPKQVIVTARILEVKKSENSESGLRLFAKILNEKLSLNFNVGAISDSIVSLKTGSINTLFSIFDTESRFNVISSPILRVMDAETGTFTVGSDVPTLGAQTERNGYIVRDINYKSSGVIFDIKPMITAQGIKLKIRSELSDFTQTKTGVNETPTLLKRLVDSTVYVNDESLIVLGGLSEEKNTQINDSIFHLPSWIFGKSKKFEKSDILLLLHAKVVDEKYKSIELGNIF